LISAFDEMPEIKKEKLPNAIEYSLELPVQETVDIPVEIML